jgi:hypothetical protein
MPEIEEIGAEAKTILARVLPSLQVVRIEAHDAPDSGGDDSLWLKIVVKQRPSRDRARKMAEVVDQLRSWLASKRDNRFPYVQLTTESEQEQLRRMAV